MKQPVEIAIGLKLERFANLVSTRDPALLGELWGKGDFLMVGSEVGEICRSEAELAAKIEAIFASPATLLFDFSVKTTRVVGPVAWVFSEGVLTRRAPDGSESSRPYLVNCVFELVDEVWAWRQFFGSEPY